MKRKLGHCIGKAYRKLPKTQQILDSAELKILDTASEAYAEKLMDYWDPSWALRGYKNFPDLEVLDRIADKLIAHGDELHELADVALPFTWGESAVDPA